MCHPGAHLTPAGDNLITIILSPHLYTALLCQIKAPFFVPQHFALFFKLNLLGKQLFPSTFALQWQSLSSTFLPILQPSLHSLLYYSLHMEKSCKAVLILSFAPSLKITSVVMLKNNSHMALVKQVIISESFSPHLYSLYYYLIFLTLICLSALSSSGLLPNKHNVYFA